MELKGEKKHGTLKTLLLFLPNVVVQNLFHDCPVAFSGFSKLVQGSIHVLNLLRLRL